jgi:AcrR family transcriptional regulator
MEAGSLTMPRSPRVRRTQAERTSDTKRALIDATVAVIHRLGYGGATTALIAEEAGVSRGAILHHFGTRAMLMAEVIRDVFEKERAEYERLDAESHLGHNVADWPSMLWQVFRKPSGLAVLEILQAARSDKELAELVTSTQQAVEDLAQDTMTATYGSSRGSLFMDEMRLIVWAIRGLSIAQVLVKDPEEIGGSVALFSRILQAADDAGVFAPKQKG